MLNKDIYNQFKKLSFEKGDEKIFSVIPIPNTNHKLGVSIEGYPKFFVCTNDKSSSTSNKILEILSVEYNLPCTFVDDENNKNAIYYTTITLLSSDTVLQEDFIDIVIMILSRLNPIPSKKEISIEVENIISIFSAMKCQPRKKVQGLWAELLIIERSSNPDILINAWHENPTAKYDFTMGRDKIEVKSTSSENRVHHFSLDQLCPTEHSRLVIASVIVRESAKGNGGMSVINLYERICSKVENIDLRLRTMKIIAETMGTNMHSLNDLYFDYVCACDSLKFYNSKKIPGVKKNDIQKGVSKVGFNSDLSNLLDIHADGYDTQIQDSPLFKSILS